ncbi:oleosin H2-like [Gastrolobium bilobum]|uniref:oleosin H2-like n=1 Tax=Gastrolobium bilobum TaxID=150636 RepID=UPI002AB07593|nr:oleosin H2-like [Gastrolobium bilobum]
MEEPHQTRKEKNSPPASQVLALSILVPFGATLLFLAGITLTATVTGLAVTAPLFVIFSPVLFPATLVIGLAVVGFLTSGAFGVTSLSSFASMANYLRRSRLPETLQHAKWRAQEIVGQVAHKTQGAGDSEESTAVETGQEAQSEAR